MKDWMLPIAMTLGAASYLVYHALPQLHFAGPFLSELVSILQPLLIFTMLFLTLCRIEPKDLKPHRWHWWLLLIQGGIFVLLGLGWSAVARWLPLSGKGGLVIVESVMLCLICPTATAAAVVTRKLGGDVPGIMTYTILINVLAAVLVPLIVPLVHPMQGVSFFVAFSMIMVKVFPLLIMPCFCAWLVRYLFPKLHRKLVSWPDLPFYLWSVALILAICVTTRSIVHSTLGWGLLACIAAASLASCIFQFAAGKAVGSRYGRRAGKHSKKITAGQALGQKNTILSIWIGYTFKMPETAIVGGLYSIWHNIYNSWQLYKARKGTSQE